MTKSTASYKNCTRQQSLCTFNQSSYILVPCQNTFPLPGYFDSRHFALLTITCTEHGSGMPYVTTSRRQQRRYKLYRNQKTSWCLTAASLVLSLSFGLTLCHLVVGNISWNTIVHYLDWTMGGNVCWKCETFYDKRWQVHLWTSITQSYKTHDTEVETVVINLMRNNESVLAQR